MKQLIRKFKQVLIFILAISVIGCENEDAERPQVVAGFTYTLNEETGLVTFINISENANTYEWSFGDNTNSTEINPVHIYASGTYTVVLKSKNHSGASDTFESVITINIPLAITLPVTFDDPNVAYKVATFNGTAFAIVDNPSVSGTNNKASKVGAITNTGKAFEGINFDLSAPIDLATDKTISINIWSNSAVSILLKLEQGTGADVEVTANHGGTGWETILFNFSASNKYSRVTLFVDGPGTKTGTFYIDDITQIETPPAPCTADIAQSLAATDFNLTFLTDPTSSIVEDGGDFEWITNPDFDNALNTSCKVGKVTRNAGLQFANNQINFTAPLNFSTKSGFKMKVWSAAIGTKVTVKLEGGVVSEVTQTTTKASEWEELTFDFASSVTGNNKIVLFFNINTFTGGTFFFDDFKLYGTGSGGGGACTPDAAQTLTAAGFNLTFASNPGTMATRGEAVGKFLQDGTTYAYVDNPGTSALNNSCKVGKVTNNNQNPWDNIQIDLANKLTFTDGSNFKMKIYAPQSGYKVTLKLEDKTSAGAINSGDKPSTTSTTLTNGWEELTFNFGAVDSGKYDKIVLFFDLQTKNGNTYYFDDLKLNLGTGGGGGGGTGTGGCTGTVIAATSFPVNFEGCQSFIDTFKDSGNITTELAANPSKAGINTSNFVLKVVKAAGTNRWAGFQNAFPSNFDATKTFKFKVYSSKANVVMRFEINSNPQPNGSGNPGPQFATIANANTWTEVTITFTGIPGNNTGMNQLVIKPDNPDGTDGTVTSSEGIYYFDDIRLE